MSSKIGQQDICNFGTILEIGETRRNFSNADAFCSQNLLIFYKKMIFTINKLELGNVGDFFCFKKKKRDSNPLSKKFPIIFPRRSDYSSSALIEGRKSFKGERRKLTLSSRLPAFHTWLFSSFSPVVKCIFGCWCSDATFTVRLLTPGLLDQYWDYVCVRQHQVWHKRCFTQTKCI